MTSSTYEPPRVKDLGSLAELTEMAVNKIGPSPDALTVVDPNVVGSFTPISDIRLKTAIEPI